VIADEIEQLQRAQRIDDAGCDRLLDGVARPRKRGEVVDLVRPDRGEQPRYLCGFCDVAEVPDQPAGLLAAGRAARMGMDLNSRGRAAAG
jgi:hypothetical protein